MFRWSKSKIYGIQLLDYEIKCIGLQPANKTWQITDQIRMPLPLGTIMKGRIMNKEVVIQHLQRLVYENHIANSQVYITIPTSNVLLRKTTYPALPDKELRNLIDVELHGEDKLPFKNPVFDYVRISAPNADKMNDVLIFASPEELISSYTHAVRSADLKVIGVDIAPLATYRVMTSTQLNDHAPLRFAMLNAELDHADICIFENGWPTFIRSVALSSSNVMYSENGATEAYCRTLSIELSRILNFFKYTVSDNHEELEVIYFTGHAEHVAVLPDFLKNMFHGEIIPMPVPEFAKNRPESISSFAVPLGLAMKGEGR